MEQSDRRAVPLAGLSLIGAGAALGLALAVPAGAAPPDPPRPAQTNSAPVVDQDLRDR